jgi:hypothetical protein
VKTELILITLLATAPVCLCAEQKSEPGAPKTKLQAFEALSGAVIIKGYSEIGSVAGMGQVSVDAKEFTNASTRRSEYGITIEVKESGRLQREDTSFIDYEEIESLLAGIDYVKDIKRDITRLRGFEAVYRTKGDFSITVFSSSSGKIEAAVSSGRIGRATAFFSLEKLDSLRALIVEAKNALDNVKK